MPANLPTAPNQSSRRFGPLISETSDGGGRDPTFGPFGLEMVNASMWKSTVYRQGFCFNSSASCCTSRQAVNERCDAVVVSGEVVSGEVVSGKVVAVLDHLHQEALPGGNVEPHDDAREDAEQDDLPAADHACKRQRGQYESLASKFLLPRPRSLNGISV